MFKRENYTALIIIVLISGFTSAQTDMYLPLNVEKAYTQGTRSHDGKPGPAYWQNTSDYIIEAEFNPVTRLLTGKEKIVYHNNSPDKLTKIVIRLYQNIYRYGAPRDFQINEVSLSAGVNLSLMKFNGTEMDLSDPKVIRRYATNISVIPPVPVEAGVSTEIEINWDFTVPAGYPIRMGTIDSTTYFIAYWYPQIAVYDDIDGWDEFNFGGEQEFYNDISNYDVKITVPAEFGVWATGLLQNPSQVLTAEYLERYTQALSSDSIINIVANADSGKTIFNDTGTGNTWHYKADNVPDFAFATSDHYLWDASSLQPEAGSDRRTYIAAVYNRRSQDFYNVASITREVIKYFSDEIPGYPFPYPSLTVFNGSGGMEFPMIINNGSEKEHSATTGLTAHEAAHQYFPFYTGMNERKYAWMDEGLAVMTIFDFQDRNGGRNRSSNTSVYQSLAGRDTDLPPIIPTTMARGTWYRMVAYVRPGAAFMLLENTLGKEVFRKCLKEFIIIWRGKHPIPYDFFNTFNQTAGEDLSWFWQPWFFERGYPDLAIKEVTTEGKSIKVTIERKGSFPVPVKLIFEDSNDKKIEKYEPASVWKDGSREYTFTEHTDFNVKTITLGDENIPDVNTGDNFYNIR